MSHIRVSPLKEQVLQSTWGGISSNRGTRRVIHRRTMDMLRHIHHERLVADMIDGTGPNTVVAANYSIYHRYHRVWR